MQIGTTGEVLNLLSIQSPAYDESFDIFER